MECQQEQKISAAEMRMLRWMNVLENKKIKNECIQEKVGVTPIQEKMTDICLRLFGLCMICGCDCVRLWQLWENEEDQQRLY